MHTVAFTKPNAERIAARHLLRFGIETYLPCYRNEHRNRVLLFSRYVFIKLTRDWHWAYRARGIAHLFLRDDETPVILPDAFIEGLRARERNGVVDLREGRFKAGQRLRVIRGQFNKMIAVYERQNQRGNDEALVEILGRQVKVEFGPEQLAAESA